LLKEAPPNILKALEEEETEEQSQWSKFEKLQLEKQSVKLFK
jgi:hypothetical protein